MSLLCAVAAVAHPLGEGAATHTLSLVLHRDQVDVSYAVDVPNVFLRGPGDPLASMSVELTSGLLLTVDGQVLSMTPLPSPAPTPSSDHTTGFAVHLTAPLPQQPRHLELSTANLQEASNLFAQDLRVEPGWRLASASMLVRGPDGHIARDDTLRWRRGEDGRTLSVDLAGRWPDWWLWLTQSSPEPVRALAAHRTPQLTPNRWLLFGLGAALLGVSTGRTFGLRALAVALVGLPLALLPAKYTGWLEFVVAMAVILAWLGTFRLPWQALGLAAAGLAATCHLPGPAVGILLAFGLGALCRSQPHPRLAAAGILLALLVLLVRSETL